mmetsp:Transcript_17133/g.58577  ORF Transcript_17133/g.58577 Transcript_17133/m.58577 type:complete len:467 (-) Transcript_17133:710-2110(-)
MSKDAKKGEAPAPELDPEEQELVERELVIGNLKNKLGKYAQKISALQQNNTVLKDELDTQRYNLKDINDFLTSENAQKDEMVAQLEGEVRRLETELEECKDGFKQEMDATTMSNLGETRGLQGRIDAHESKLRELDEFREQKERLEADLAAMEAQLERERAEHEAHISDMERKAAAEKERLRKEMIDKIRKTRSDMMRMTDEQLETTTKRTITENDQMTSELLYQGREAQKLKEWNEKLVSETAALRKQLNAGRRAEGELAKRNHVYQKTVKTLLAKLEAQERVKARDDEDIVLRRGENATLEDQVASLEREVSEAAAHAEDLRASNEAVWRDVEAHEQSRDECARFLQDCLDDVGDALLEARLPGPGGGGPGGRDILALHGQMDELSLEQRKRAIEYLLEKLTSPGGGASGAGGLPPPGAAATPRPRPAARPASRPARARPSARHMTGAACPSPTLPSPPTRPRC